MNRELNITADIEARLEENKTAIKTYAAYETAEKKAVELAEAVKTFYDATGAPRYLIVYLPKSGRFTIVVHFAEFLRGYSVGGYIGFISDRGFYTI